MNRTPIHSIPEAVPATLRPWLNGAVIYDSSCSPDARVYYIEKDTGFYLKSAPKGTLRTEAEMTRYFHSKGLSAEVVGYESENRDWLLTARIPGEDCLHRMYLDDPVRLCDTMAAVLRQLHGQSVDGCSINRTQSYIAAAERNYRTGNFDSTLFPDNWGFASAGEAWAAMQAGIPYLKADTLIHGDYCLPNVILDNWRFSGFIDVGAGGIGDRHIDLFWSIWSLGFNLKTDRYTQRLLDAYGREDVEPEMLRTIAAFEVFG